MQLPHGHGEASEDDSVSVGCKSNVQRPIDPAIGYLIWIEFAGNNPEDKRPLRGTLEERSVRLGGKMPRPWSSRVPVF